MKSQNKPMDSTVQNNHNEVLALMDRYFEGLYRCNVELLKTVFHPEAQYFTASDGILLHLDIPTYLPIVKARCSPIDAGEDRVFQVESMEFAGPVTALVRATSTMFGLHYDDFLTLLKIDGDWRVISKVFHAEPAITQPKN